MMSLIISMLVEHVKPGSPDQAGPELTASDRPLARGDDIAIVSDGSMSMSGASRSATLRHT